MRLLFAYFDYSETANGAPSARRLGECELNLAVEYDFRVETTTRPEGNRLYRLSCTARPDTDRLPTGFWGERIYNVSALVGENGTGKSTLLVAIIKAVVRGLDPGVPFFLVFRETDSEMLAIYRSKGLELAVDGCPVNTSQIACPTDEYPDAFRRAKVMLVDNALTLASLTLDEAYSDTLTTPGMHVADSIRTVPVYESDKQLYNKSLAASMRFSDEISNAKRPIAQRTSVPDTLRSYLQYESFQETRYLFDPFIQKTIRSLRDDGHPFPCPTYLYVTTYGVEQLHNVFAARHETQQHANLHFPKALKPFKAAGYFESLLACALYLMYVYFAPTIYGADIKEIFDTTYFWDDSPSLFASVEEFAACIVERTASATKDGAWVPDDMRDRVARCHGLVKYVLENEDLLRDIFLPVPVEERSDSSSDSRTHRVDIEDVLNHPSKRRCVSGFLDNYRLASETEYFLTFSCGLSSGEKSLLQLLTHFRYALAGPSVRLEDAAPGEYKPDTLVNWFSTADKPGHEDRREHEEETCDTLLLFLDEADLTLHPEWQRQYVSLLTAILPRMFRDPYGEGGSVGCKDIQVILTTHSPLLLSDMPRQSCIFLKRENGRNVVADDTEIKKTFGTNVQDLLRSAFFLRRTIGEFARDKIVDEVFKDLQALSNQEDGADPERCRQHRGVIELIGDRVLHDKLLVLYDRCFPTEAALLAMRDVRSWGGGMTAEDRNRLITSMEETLEMLRSQGGEER